MRLSQGEVGEGREVKVSQCVSQGGEGKGREQGVGHKSAGPSQKLIWRCREKVSYGCRRVEFSPVRKSSMGVPFRGRGIQGG